TEANLGHDLLSPPSLPSYLPPRYLPSLPTRRSSDLTNLHQPPQPVLLVPEHFREPDDPAGDAYDHPEKPQVVAHARAFLRHYQLIAVLHVQVVERTPLRHGRRGHGRQQIGRAHV